MRLISKFALLACLLLFVSACGGGDDGGNHGGQDETPCLADSDCPEGYACGAQNVCISEDDVNADGDADDSETSDAPETVQEGRILRVVPNAIDFGDVQISVPKEVSVTIYNDGNAALHLQDANWLSPQTDNPFALKNYLSATIQPGGEFAFSVTFNPETLGAVVGELQINNDSDNVPELLIDVSANVISESNYASFYVTPEALDFGEKTIGTSATQESIVAGNDGGGSDEVHITRVHLFSQEEMADSPFSIAWNVLEPPTQDEPISLGQGATETFRVRFDPIGTGAFDDTLVFTYQTDTEPTPKTLEVPISGHGIEGALGLTPSILDFGQVLIGEDSTVLASLTNNTQETISISNIRINSACLTDWPSFFEFDFLGGDSSPDLQAGQTINFDMIFSPTDEKDYSCELQIDTSYQGSTKFFFPFIAEGVRPGQRPVARIAREPNGADIQTNSDSPLEFDIGHTQTFYGDISYDPDGESALLDYEWRLNKPAGSQSSLSAIDEPIITVYFDVTGRYSLELIVEDEAGQRSIPKIVHIKIGESTGGLVKVEMHTSGITGASDADLFWVLPMGITCQADDNICNTPNPEEQGSLLVEGCGSASVCTVESIAHANPPDGIYEIRAKFEESCPDTVYGCPLGLGEETANVSIYIYVNDQLAHQLTGHTLQSEGDMKSWRFQKSNGIWQTPQPMR